MAYLRRRGFGATALVSSLAAAITRQESINPSYNNPGALRSGPGQVGTSASGFAIFPDLATGEAALENQIQLNINRGLTLDQFFAGQRDASGNVIPGGYPGYAPAADSNQPNIYAQHVALWAGVDPTIPLNQVSGSQDLTLSPADFTPADVLSSLGSLDPVTIGVGLGLLALVVWAVRS